MLNDFAVHARSIGKCYQIYNQPLDRLKQSLWRGKRRFYEEFWALKNASFEIKKGETVGIIGSNGSGKSTLMQLMCGTVNPTAGEIEVRGRVAALLELGAGFNPEFTGRENVYVNSAIMGLSRAETDARYDEIAEFAGIGSFIEQPVKTYSTGMYVRLAFAVAVNVSPDILLVDEVLSVGDARFQQKCMAKIRRFCQKGTVIFASHDMAAITELCSRVLWIEAGKLRLNREPKFVVEKYLEFMYEGDMGLEKSQSEISRSSKTKYPLQKFVPVTKELRQFGNRKATIESIRFISRNGSKGLVYAGEECEISIFLRVHEKIAKPIFGYIVKNRLGQEIFGDNTVLMKYPVSPLSSGQSGIVTFRLNEWPNLLNGDYLISVAVGDGTVEKHSQCHWIYDAVVVKNISEQPPVGIFSIPNTNVEFLRLKG
ncbi:MAG: ABC transporter ATP-binding protein [Proteobacteria bacterium]|nr:ABC transporter ATP-binding protein [Pseudomonadota bacterium]